MACRSADDVDVALPGILEDVSAELPAPSQQVGERGMDALRRSLVDQKAVSPGHEQSGSDRIGIKGPE